MYTPRTLIALQEAELGWGDIIKRGVKGAMKGASLGALTGLSVPGGWKGGAIAGGALNLGRRAREAYRVMKMQRAAKMAGAPEHVYSVEDPTRLSGELAAWYSGLSARAQHDVPHRVSRASAAHLKRSLGDRVSSSF